jgi:hypothetical protein
MVNKRKIPILIDKNFSTSKRGDVYKSLIEGVEEGLQKNLKTIKLAEIKVRGLYQRENLQLMLPKEEWVPSLEKALIYFEDSEEYEHCSEIQTLIKKL